MIDSNLAGIIPISGQKRVDYDFPWHDCLMPIGNNYYAIQQVNDLLHPQKKRPRVFGEVDIFLPVFLTAPFSRHA